MSSLRVLLLAQNKLGDEGVRMLADALPKASRLQQLVLNANSVTDAAAAVLLKSLPGGPPLELLALAGNRLQGFGIAAVLQEVLPRCTSLQTLDLSSNPLGAMEAAAIEAAWRLLRKPAASPSNGASAAAARGLFL